MLLKLCKVALLVNACCSAKDPNTLNFAYITDNTIYLVDRDSQGLSYLILWKPPTSFSDKYDLFGVVEKVHF